jgi:hypothetical protein
MQAGVTLVATQTNPTVGDMMLNEAGTEVVMHTSLAAEVAQKIHIRLNFFKGEWFLDLDAGTPYYEHILKKGVTDRVIRAVFGAVITTTPGVSELTKLSYSVSSDRRLSLTFQCRLKDGTTLKSSDFAAFVINV